MLMYIIQLMDPYFEFSTSKNISVSNEVKVLKCRIIEEFVCIVILFCLSSILAHTNIIVWCNQLFLLNIMIMAHEDN